MAELCKENLTYNFTQSICLPFPFPAAWSSEAVSFQVGSVPRGSQLWDSPKLAPELFNWQVGRVKFRLVGKIRLIHPTKFHFKLMTEIARSIPSA